MVRNRSWPAVSHYQKQSSIHSMNLFPYNLQLHCFSLQIDGSNFLSIHKKRRTSESTRLCETHEIYSNGADVALSVGVIGKSKKQTGFPHSRVSNEQKFEKIVATRSVHNYFCIKWECDGGVGCGGVNDDRFIKMRQFKYGCGQQKNNRHLLVRAHFCKCSKDDVGERVMVVSGVDGQQLKWSGQRSNRCSNAGRGRTLLPKSGNSANWLRQCETSEFSMLIHNVFDDAQSNISHTHWNNQNKNRRYFSCRMCSIYPISFNSYSPTKMLQFAASWSDVKLASCNQRSTTTPTQCIVHSTLKCDPPFPLLFILDD